MFDFAYGQYRISGCLPNGQFIDQLRLITSPFMTSLYRFRNKLLWNVIAGSKFYETAGDTTFAHKFDFDREIKTDPYFITLTVSDEHYQKVFVDRAGSKTIARFLNNVRSFMRRGSKRFHRPPFAFSYAWRLERGKQKTQRYHFHLITFVAPEGRPYLKDYILSHWKYCQWDKLAKDIKKDGKSALDHSFQDADNANAAAIYACKYSTKMTEEKDFVAEVKNEVRCRIVSSTRDIRPIPKELKPKFNYGEKRWSFFLKDHFTMLPPHLNPLGLFTTHQIIKFEAEINRKFDQVEDLADASARLRDTSIMGDAALTELNDELKDSIRDIKDRFSYRQKPSPIYGALTDKQKDMLKRGPNPIKFAPKLLIDKWLNHPKTKISHRDRNVSSNHL